MPFPAEIYKKPKFETRPLPLVLTEVLSKGVRSKLVSRVFLPFDINIKERRSPGNEVA